MRILVVGGCGFIGSHLVRRLEACGHRISVLDLFKSEDRPLVRHFAGSHDDRELLVRLVHGQDAVVHLVSTTVPATSNENIEFDVQSNLVSVVRLLEAMKAQQVSRLVYVSSGGAVYGETEQYPITEDHPLNPISSYGVVKVAVEKYLLMFQHLHAFQPVIIRPANAYGPGQNLVKPQGVIGHFLARAIQNKPLQVIGDGSVRRDYIYIDDLVSLIVRAIDSQVSGIFNAGAGVDSSVNEIIEILEQLVARPLEKDFLPARTTDVRRVRLDITRAQQTFDWNPSVPLKFGIRRQFEALKQSSPSLNNGES